MTFERFIVGIIGIPLGFVILYYRVPIRDFIGNIGWAEKYLGTGGTWNAIVLIGLAVSIFSFLWMLGSVQVFFLNNFGVFFGGNSAEFIFFIKH